MASNGAVESVGIDTKNGGPLDEAVAEEEGGKVWDKKNGKMYM